MKFASLGSGSEGNALLISAAAGDQRPPRGRRVLDCGFTCAKPKSACCAWA
jgi:hypothetical protein